ncbi:MAG TPA: acyl-CoA dehydrogenase family protein [Frankiaceae bacterium]|jgi:alkylation response protein AidB-like acyl-CoA dehydrogenase|nr:acyl-CoA dehydrogenase family protein [Frankiaceae bacterium]
MELAAFRSALDGWLDEHADELTPADPVELSGPAVLDAHMAQLAKVKNLAYGAGFMRWGWPERVGGLGGSSILRAYLGEALTGRGLVEPGVYCMTEVLAPTMIDYAPAGLAGAMVPRLLRGDETWCQGFSEPGTGSNLAALQCRAALTDGTWRVNGQKVWTSFAQYADRCILLTRTGAPDSAHRGITALFIDMDTPGITVRPLETMNGIPEFSEVFFDDVAVPAERTLGEVDQGWAIAMGLLPYERSTALWHRGAFLRQRLRELLTDVSDGQLAAEAVGTAFAQLYAFRARSRQTQYRMAAGETLAAETSIDKVLLATAEQSVFDLAAEGLPEQVLLDDDDVGQAWRTEYLYSRAATIYGGTGEIQRNVIARRLLDLGPDR